MDSNYGKYNQALTEFNDRRELLKNAIKECVSLRDNYISRNKQNEKELERLTQIKEGLTYLKEVLLQDFHKSNINAGKRRILLNKRLTEFQEKSHKIELQQENLPGICQLKELVQANEELLLELLKWNEMLVNVKERYSTAHRDLVNQLKLKIIEFSEEIMKNRD